MRWLLLLLLIVPVQAAFDAPPALDIIARGHIHDENGTTAWPNVGTWFAIDGAYYSLLREPDACFIVSSSGSQFPIEVCHENLHAVGAINGKLISCAGSGSGITMTAHDTGGNLTESISHLMSVNVPVGSASATWVCQHASYGGRWYVAANQFSSQGALLDHAIMVVNEDLTLIEGTYRIPAMSDELAVGDRSMTLTGVQGRNGYIVASYITTCQPDATGRMCIGTGTASMFGIAWLSQTGPSDAKLIDAVQAWELDPTLMPEDTLRLSGPSVPTIRGNVVVAHLGRNVIGFDIRQPGLTYAHALPEPTLTPDISSPLVAPIAYHDLTLIPRMRDVVAVDLLGDVLWSWDGLHQDAFVLDVKRSTDNEYHILTTSSHPLDAAPWPNTIAMSNYVRLDENGKQIMQLEVPLPTIRYDGGAWGTHGNHPQFAGPQFLPETRGAKLIAPTGEWAQMGDAPGAPIYIDSPRYPPVGTEVTADVSVNVQGSYAVHYQYSHEPEAKGMAVNGDAIATIFLDAGDAYLSVTATNYESGHTFTKRHLYQVGVVPPGGSEDLNWMQLQFTPERQETTWGIIGILMVLFGAFMATLSRLWGRRKIHGGITELKAIQNRYQNHPEDMIFPLREWRRRQDKRLVAGKLTEDQFRILETKAQHALEWAISKMLGPVSESVSSGVWRQLRWSLRDGHINEDEWKGIMGQCKDADTEAILLRIQRAFLVDPRTGFKIPSIT